MENYNSSAEWLEIMLEKKSGPFEAVRYKCNKCFPSSKKKMKEGEITDQFNVKIMYLIWMDKKVYEYGKNIISIYNERSLSSWKSSCEVKSLHQL